MKSPAGKNPLLTTGMVSAATVTTALLSPASFGASGDLDPAFGDVGRLGPILDGPAWSLEQQADGTILLGGGSPGYYYYYYGAWYGASAFVSLVSDTGVADPALATADFGTAQIIDAARQPDGQFVAVGRRLVSGYEDTRLYVARVLPDGTLDEAFGSGGQFILSGQEHGNLHGATSVVLDPDGRIVVAGSKDGNLIVLRLLPDGSLDQSFAAAGIFDGPANVDHSGGRSGARTNLIRNGSGGYRATTNAAEGCQVVALTVDGNLDASFGDSGVATIVTAAGPTTYCNSMDAQPNARLLVAGSGGGRGFAARLLADGQLDPAFDADAVPTVMTEATAVAADGNEAAVVAGLGDDDPIIVRLGAGGALDATFGDAGVATYDLQTEGSLYPVVYDLNVGADRSIVGAGGVCRPDNCYWGDQAFVVRLLGDGGDSPGVLGFSERYDIVAREDDGEAVIDVRRTGGRSGSVGVSWQTVVPEWDAATPGTDYTAASGSLTWEDGDAATQQIRVPIFADDAAERQESFQIVLGGQQDGAGLGKHRATIVIVADGDPHGQISFVSDTFDISESTSEWIAVSRDYYSSGAVSVTLTFVSGTATAGTDFVANPITVSWADGEFGWKNVEIPIINDTGEERTETFTVALSGPTGGAIIGPISSATVRISGNDRGAGGGAFGWLSLVLLAGLRLMRRRADDGQGSELK